MQNHDLNDGSGLLFGYSDDDGRRYHLLEWRNPTATPGKIPRLTLYRCDPAGCVDVARAGRALTHVPPGQWVTLAVIFDGVALWLAPGPRAPAGVAAGFTF